MALVLPHAIVAGTTIDAGDIQDNNNAIKAYLNGGIANIAVTPAFKSNHVMNGEYITDNVDYDMTSGHEIGPQELPSMLVGALPKYWATNASSPKTIPRTGTTFYMKQPGTILVRYECHVRGYESETAAPFSTSSANIYCSLDGARALATMHTFQEENDWGTSVGGAVIPSWEKRRSFNGHFMFLLVSAGEHSVELMGTANSQAFFLKNLSFTIEQHYS
jgi:hypothetical protein